MIKTEFLNDGKLIRHYSDSDNLLLQVETGMIYGEAIDVYPSKYTYKEVEDDAEISDEEAMSIIMGVK